MRAKEFIKEDNTGSLQKAVARAMPEVHALTDLKNQDMYLQYRMGLALARARAQEKGYISAEPAESAFGENMIIVTPTEEEKETLRLALKLIGPGRNSDEIISTKKSEEPSDTNYQSIVPNQKRS